MSRIDRVLHEARSALSRLTPAEALAAQRGDALLVDVRTDEQRQRYGAPPGALAIDLTILLWRLDPTSAWRIPGAADDALPIVLCQQGYSSSVAARALQALGLARATDVVGGFDAWVRAGLPVTHDLPARVP